MAERNVTVPASMLLCACYTALFGYASVAAETQAEWRAGAASVVITPEENMWMAGYAARNKPSQ